MLRKIAVASVCTLLLAGPLIVGGAPSASAQSSCMHCNFAHGKCKMLKKMSVEKCKAQHAQCVAECKGTAKAPASDAAAKAKAEAADKMKK